MAAQLIWAGIGLLNTQNKEGAIKTDQLCIVGRMLRGIRQSQD
jgi:hypothetical protein